MFGVTGYEAARRLPPALLRSAIQIEQQRQAEARLAQRRDMAMAAALDLGKRHVDPKNPHGNRKSDEPYVTIEPYLADTERLERVARPWEFTEAAIIRRRELEEEREFAALEKAMGGMRA